jgi:membrane protease YdiL (CAAX protease family)
VSFPIEPFEPEDRLWRIRHAVLAFAMGFLAAGIAQVALGPDLSASEIFRVVVPTQTLVTIGAVVWMAALSADRRSELGLSAAPEDLTGLAVGAGLQVALSLVIALVVTLLNFEAPEQEIVTAADEAIGALDRALVVLGAGLLAPAAEELLFRGILLRVLLRRYGSRWAVYGSSAVFAAVHFFDPNAVLAIPVLYVVGIVLARQAIKTGRLGRPFLTHAGFNLLSVLALFIVEAEGALG